MGIHLSSWIQCHLSKWVYISAVEYTSQQLGTHLSSWLQISAVWYISAVEYTSQQLDTMSPQQFGTHLSSWVQCHLSSWEHISAVEYNVILAVGYTKGWNGRCVNRRQKSGRLFYESMSMTDHVNRLVRSCFYQLRRIKSIRRSLPTSTAVQLVNSFVISRVDYCNSLQAGLPKY